MVELAGGVKTGPWDEAVQQMIPPAPDCDRSAWIIVKRIGPLRGPVLTRAEVTRHCPRGVWAVKASKIEQLGGGIRATSHPAPPTGV